MGMRWAAETHVNPATGAFGGAPCGATKRVRGVPKWACGGPRKFYEPCHWGLIWSSLWGYETRAGRAEMGMRWAAAIL